MVGKLQFLLLVDELLDVLHIFNEIEDDILSEQHLDLFETQLSSVEHVPADGSSGSENHTNPFSCIGLKISHIKILIDLLFLHQIDYFKPDFHLSFIAKRHDLRDDTIMPITLLLSLLFFLKHIEQHLLVVHLLGIAMIDVRLGRFVPLTRRRHSSPLQLF